MRKFSNYAGNDVCNDYAEESLKDWPITTPKQYKGVAYYPSREEAELRMAEDAPTGRVVAYTRGWAVQIRISGPYLSL